MVRTILIFLYIFTYISLAESHGILVQNLVGYHTFGHMFFLEDGGEHNNTIDRVLGLNAYPVPAEDILKNFFIFHYPFIDFFLQTKFGIKTQVIPTDNSPSIFWVSNFSVVKNLVNLC